MLPPKKSRDLARRLVAREADSNITSLQTEPASVRVYERLRRQLGAPVGADSFQSLASRALALARSESPRLRAVQVMANGGLRGLAEVLLNYGERHFEGASGSKGARTGLWAAVLLTCGEFERVSDLGCLYVVLVTNELRLSPHSGNIRKRTSKLFIWLLPYLTMVYCVLLREPSRQT